MDSQIAESLPAKKPNIIKRLYNWVLKWADSKWGTVALFVIAFTESSFFPIPPDVLLIALCLGMPKKSLWYAFVCLAGSLLGATFGYAIGYWAWGAFDHLFIPALFTQEAFDSVGALYDKWNFWAVFISTFTPIPYKLFAIAAGVFNINLGMFLFASAIGRGLRFLLLGGLIWKFGAPIKTFIDKYFNWLALLFAVLVISGFVLVKYVL